MIEFLLLIIALPTLIVLGFVFFTFILGGVGLVINAVEKEIAKNKALQKGR